MEFNPVNYSRYIKQKIGDFSNQFKFFKTQLSCCDLCGGCCQSQPMICDYCLADLPLFDLQALHGDLLSWPSINTILPKRSFDHLIAVSPYQWPIDLWIRQLKYQGRFELVDLLSTLLFQQWKNAVELDNSIPESIDKPCLMSVPIHLNKWKKRGFNQAHLLAEEFARKANMVYLPNALRRINNDLSQAGQTGNERRKNLRHAFELSISLFSNPKYQPIDLPQHVILLDDVVTTGSTCNEICRLLKQNGVKKITVISLCLSLPINKT
jgi:ComF family protein